MVNPRPQTFVGWLISAVIVVGSSTACGVALIWGGVDPARAYLAGTPGQVTVSDCRWENEKPRGWDCRGTFNGKGVAISEVRIRFLLDAEPVNPVDTVVSGSRSTTAWTPGATLLGPIIAGFFIVGIAPTVGLYYWRQERRERAAEQALKRAEREKIRQELADLRTQLREIATDLKAE
jgi:hypothetical protein